MTRVGTFAFSSSSAASRSGPAGQLQRLILVGEQQVDAAAVDHLPKPSLRPAMHTLSDKVKATLRPARMGDLDRLHHRRARLFGPEQIAFEVKDRRRCDQARVERIGDSSWLAPGQVFIVRCASGVTRIRQRPVGGPPISARRVEPHAQRMHVMLEDQRRAGPRRSGR